MFLNASGFSVLLELGDGRVGFSDADGCVVPAAKVIGYPARDYLNSGLVGDDGREWIDLETVVGGRPAEYGVC